MTKTMNLVCLSCEHKWAIEIPADHYWQDGWNVRGMIPNGMFKDAAHGTFCKGGVHTDRWFTDGRRRLCVKCSFIKVRCPACNSRLAFDADSPFVRRVADARQREANEAADRIIANGLLDKIDRDGPLNMTDNEKRVIKARIKRWQRNEW